jgi:periplasmic protein TonB
VSSTQTIFDFREEWKSSVTLSALFHGLLFGTMVVFSLVSGRSGENWGGAISAEGAMSARLVSSAVPLPSAPTETENVLADESKGLSESQPAERQPEPEAIPIPDKPAPKVKAPEKAPVPKPKTVPKPVQPVTNVVPFGRGGPTNMYSMVRTDIGTGGISLGENGSFGSRYSWYVDTVRRKVSENWMKYEIDPSIANAGRVYITFDIARNGVPSNIQVSQSSGVPSLDLSAKRALQRIDTFGPLPNDYAGGRVSVEFWFDYKK